MPTIETQREGYLALAAISLSETRRNEFESFISSVDDYNGHDDYYTTLNFVMNWLNEQRIAWTCAVDWKSEISLLRSKIGQQLNLISSSGLSIPKAMSVLFVHRVDDAEAAREAVGKIGYRYMDRGSPNVRDEPPVG